jgi:hypothetical protein
MVIWRASIQCIICLRPAVMAVTKLDGAVVPYCAEHFRRKLQTFPEVFREIRNTREIERPSR